jgi:putative ABC transport system substrate-binding protein
VVSLLLCALLFALCVSAHAQQAKKVPRLGYLSSGDPASESARAEGIRLALRELGYLEGQNIAIEFRYAERKQDRASNLAAELVRLKVDIIVVAGGPTWIRPVQNATKAIPIVMVGVGGDPVEQGLVKSLARPGGNVTGITNLSSELGGKRLELFKETVPKLAHVAVLHVPTSLAGVYRGVLGGDREVKEVQAIAPALGLTVLLREVRAADDFDSVFAALTKQRPDGIYVPGGGALMFANEKRVADFALNSRLPSMFINRATIDAGGLMYYGADFADSYRHVATYVDRILKGAKPADLPVEQPTKFELVINLKTAKAIGVIIPQKVLARADRVIR